MPALAQTWLIFTWNNFKHHNFIKSYKILHLIFSCRFHTSFSWKYLKSMQCKCYFTKSISISWGTKSLQDSIGVQNSLELTMFQRSFNVIIIAETRKLVGNFSFFHVVILYCSNIKLIFIWQNNIYFSISITVCWWITITAIYFIIINLFFVIK